MDFRRFYPEDWDIFDDSNLNGVKEYLRRGIDPNYQYYCGVTLLHRAVNIPTDNIRVVREIIKSGADVNLCNHLDVTPLHNALFYRKRLVIDELIQAGALLNGKDFLGNTVLHLAISKWPKSFSFHQDTWIIDKLLEQESIDCNLVDSNGETPLMMAVKSDELYIVMTLLEKDADPNISDNNLETPLHVSFSQSLGYMQNILLRAGANIYSLNKNGETPLDILIKKGLKISSYEWRMVILKLIAFKYTITNDFKQKLDQFPYLSNYFRKCCDEADRVRSDFVFDKLTVHDFILNCFNENNYKNILMQIHKPLVDRLVREVYYEYFIETLDLIPISSLFAILQMTACAKKQAKAKENRKNLADLFSKLDVIYLFSDYFWNVEVYGLIIAFSDVVFKSKRNLYESYIFYIFD